MNFKEDFLLKCKKNIQKVAISFFLAINFLINLIKKISKKELLTLLPKTKDNLSRWMIEILQNSVTPLSLTDVLEKSMDRQYSASTSERFFTAGGVHTFENFKKEDNGRVVHELP